MKKIYSRLSSAAVMIGTLRVKIFRTYLQELIVWNSSKFLRQINSNEIQNIFLKKNRDLKKKVCFHPKKFGLIVAYLQLILNSSKIDNAKHYWQC